MDTMDAKTIHDTALEVHGRLNFRRGASARQLLQEQPVAVLRELIAIHGIPRTKGQYDRAPKSEVLAALRAWFK